MSGNTVTAEVKVTDLEVFSKALKQAEEAIDGLTGILALVLDVKNKGRSFTITPHERKALDEGKYKDRLQVRGHSDGSVQLRVMKSE